MSALLGAGRAGLAILRWLASDLRNLVIAGLVGFVIVHLFWSDPALRRSRADAVAARDQALRDKDSEHAAHQGTIANYTAAAAAAETIRKANAERVSAEQAAITERVTNDYQDRLSALRARADALAVQLRQGGATAGDPGLSAGAGLPGAGAPAGGAAAPAAGAGLPAAVCADNAALTLRERVIASEQALQLDTLIVWIEAHGRVRTNP